MADDVKKSVKANTDIFALADSMAKLGVKSSPTPTAAAALPPRECRQHFVARRHRRRHGGTHASAATSDTS
jgi:hypothetical protein